MKLACWNVNGFRAIAGKGFASWFQSLDADLISLQEVKAHREQVDPVSCEFTGYHLFWNSAKKPGYSGTATWVKKEPLDYRPGIGIPEFDDEGRIQIFEYRDYFVLNLYFPNSQPERARLKYKLGFCEAILEFCKSAEKKGKAVVVAGDYNIAHTELDIKNAKSNHDSPGFYIEEREWMTRYLSSGMRDIFRETHPDQAGHYTWWSYRANARANNVGWRIDYHTVSSSLVDRVKEAFIQPKVMGSDHCPIILELR